MMAPANGTIMQQSRSVSDEGQLLLAARVGQQADMLQLGGEQMTVARDLALGPAHLRLLQRLEESPQKALACRPGGRSVAGSPVGDVGHWCLSCSKACGTPPGIPPDLVGS